MHESFRTASLSTEKPLDPKRFEAWAAELPANVFRAKGVVYFGAKGVNQKFIFQAVGRRWELKLDEWAFDQTPRTDLVVIGVDFEAEKMAEELKQLIDDKPDDISAETLMDIFEYK